MTTSRALLYLGPVCGFPIHLDGSLSPERLAPTARPPPTPHLGESWRPGSRLRIAIYSHLSTSTRTSESIPRAFDSPKTSCRPSANESGDRGPRDVTCSRIPSRDVWFLLSAATLLSLAESRLQNPVPVRSAVSAGASSSSVPPPCLARTSALGPHSSENATTRGTGG